MSTQTERLRKIAEAGERKKKEKEVYIQGQQRILESLKASVNKLASRIADLIELLSACGDNGIYPPLSDSGIQCGLCGRKKGHRLYYQHSDSRLLFRPAGDNSSVFIFKDEVNVFGLPAASYVDNEAIESFLSSFDCIERLVCDFVDTLPESSANAKVCIDRISVHDRESSRA